MTKPQPLATVLAAEQTSFGELYEYSLADLAREATDKALKAARLRVEELGLVVLASMTASALQRQGNLGAWLAQVLGLKCPVIVVDAACAGGGSALGVGLTYLQAGAAERVLVLGVEKLTDHTTEEVAGAMMQAASWEEEGVAGLTFPGLNALIASRYFFEQPEAGREDLADIAIRAHQNGLKNKWAHMRHKKLTKEEYLSSEMVAEPLCLYDCAPVSDGGGAVILAASLDDRKHSGELMQIVGFVQENDMISLARRASLTSLAATRRAMERLVRQSAVNREQIKVVELHDAFTILEPVALRDLGLGGRDDLLINPSGGLKACGHPVAATGLRQIADLGRFLQPGELGLAQNVGGVGGTVTLTLVSKP